MENTYGIGVTNRYALFLDDDADPLEVLKIQEQEKELKKKSKIAEKENKGKTEVPVKGKVNNSQRKVIKDTANHKPQDVKREDNKTTQKISNEIKNERTKYQNSNENREERNNRRNREDRGAFGGTVESNRDERPRRDFGTNNDLGEIRNRGGRGGMNRSRGGRTGRIYDQRGKREFDRQSGSDKTGVKPIDKREGGGAHNWGSHKDIIEEVDKNEADVSWGELAKEGKEEKEKDGNEIKENATETTENPAVEEEPKQFTLDEWRAQKANRQKPQYNLRKAGEGEDPSQWKKMYELNKKKEGQEEESEDEEYDASEYPQRVGRQKHILDIDIHFNDTRRGGVGGRTRGGRTGPRGLRASNRTERGGDRERTGGERDRERERQGPRSFRGGAGAPGTGPHGTAAEEVPITDEHHVMPSRHEYQFTKGGRQNAPKVDDEHDFPSLS